MIPVPVQRPDYAQSTMDFPKKRSAFTPKEQDPMSHRIIEKRRRDRMNDCLADLSRLIPTDYLKKGRGRIEKTEIIEMAIKHLKYLQERANYVEKKENAPISAEHFRLGYQECLSEVMRYLVEGQGHFPRDTVCVQLINHLQRHCANIMKGDVLNKPRSNPDSNNSSSSSSSNYMLHNQPNEAKRIMLKTADTTEPLRLSAFQHQSEEKPLATNEIEYPIQEYIQELNDNMMIKNQDNISEENITSMTTNSSPGSKANESPADEGQFHTKNSVENTDCQTAQDLRVVNSCSPSSSMYYANPAHYAYDPALCGARKAEEMQWGDSGLSLTSNQCDLDYILSYKFKNTIRQRFSQSQTTDYVSSCPSNMTNPYKREEILNLRHGEMSYKKRKTNTYQGRQANNRYYNNQYKEPKPSSDTNSSNNVTSVSQTSYRMNNVQVADLKTPKPAEKAFHVNRQGKMNYNFSKLTRVGVPIFALHAKGTFYVPLNVDYESLIPFLGPYDLLDAASMQANTSLHPITISVNFQPKFLPNKS